MVVVSILVFGPWGLLDEDEGFWNTHPKSELFRSSIALNQMLMYAPQAIGLPPIFSKPQTAALGGYNAVVGGALYADTLTERYQRKEITAEEFETQMLETINDTSISVQGEFASVYGDSSFSVLAAPSGVCPPGYTYDSALGMCMPDV